MSSVVNLIYKTLERQVDKESNQTNAESLDKIEGYEDIMLPLREMRKLRKKASTEQC